MLVPVMTALCAQRSGQFLSEVAPNGPSGASELCVQHIQ